MNILGKQDFYMNMLPPNAYLEIRIATLSACSPYTQIGCGRESHLNNNELYTLNPKDIYD